MAKGCRRGVVGIPTRSLRGTREDNRPEIGTQPTEVPTATPEPEINFGLISQDRDRLQDDRVLLAADWIDRIAALSFERLEFLTGRSSPAVPRVDGEEMALSGEIVAEGLEPPLESPRVEVASIAPSVGFGVLAMIAYRNRHRLLVKVGQTRKPGPKTGRRPLLSGPHRRLRVLR